MSWGVPYGAPPAPVLPWYRTTAFLIIGAITCLLVGAVGALIVAVVGLGVAEAGGAFDVDATTYGRGGDIGGFSLPAGACAAEPLSRAEAYGEGSAVPCDEVHAVQHYASVEPPSLASEGGTFDRGELGTFADQACLLAFEPFVGTSFELSEYDYSAIVPSPAAWAEGVRTVHCILDGGSTSGTGHLSER